MQRVPAINPEYSGKLPIREVAVLGVVGDSVTVGTAPADVRPAFSKYKRPAYESIPASGLPQELRFDGGLTTDEIDKELAQWKASNPNADESAIAEERDNIEVREQTVSYTDPVLNVTVYTMEVEVSGTTWAKAGINEIERETRGGSLESIEDMRLKQMAMFGPVGRLKDRLMHEICGHHLSLLRNTPLIWMK